MNRRYDKIWVGMVSALIWPFIIMFGYYLIYYHHMSIRHFIALIDMENSWVPRIKLCVYTNLVPFYLFLHFNQYYAVRGVILTTLIWAALVIYLMLVS